MSVTAGKATRVQADGSAITTYARMAGGSGLVFALLFTVALMLVHRAPALGVPDSSYTHFYTSGDHGALVTFGLYVVPFAGIAFLWHLTTLRLLIQALHGSPPQIPLGLQLASGVVFVCMLFAGAAAVGAVALLVQLTTAPLPEPGVARALSGVGYGLVFVYGIRAAGMFMITTTSLLRAGGLLPGWLAVLSYLTAVFLLVSTTFHPVLALIFPAWVVLLGVVLLWGAGRSEREEVSEVSAAGATDT
jgi:hypothetical protein